jgi:hypothetical protein
MNIRWTTLPPSSLHTEYEGSVVLRFVHVLTNTFLHGVTKQKTTSCAVYVAESRGISRTVSTAVLWPCGHHVITAAGRRPAGAEGATSPWGLQFTGGHEVSDLGVRLYFRNRQKLLSSLYIGRRLSKNCLTAFILCFTPSPKFVQNYGEF